MKWLITGGCGFIGSRLVENLILEKGHDIRIFDNLTVGSRESLNFEIPIKEICAADVKGGPEGLELIVGDILNADQINKAVEGVEIVVHLAANTGVGPSVEDPISDCRTNVFGTLNVLESARTAKVKRFIFASSGAPIGEIEPPIHEKLAPKPVSPYGASKLAGEGYCSAYARSFNLETVALRFGNVYGPGSANKHSVVAKFIKHALAGDALEIYGNGKQTRDFIYIDDLIKAVRLGAAAKNVGGEIFQIATSCETNLAELTDVLLVALSNAGIKEPEVIFTDSRVGDVMRNYSDTTKAKELLGWVSSTPLDKGVQETVNFFVANYDKKM